MKVLHIIDTLRSGGAERVCVDLVNLLANSGHEVSILLITEKGPLLKQLNKRVSQFFLKRKFKFGISKANELAKYLTKYDIVHVHMRHNFRYVALINLIWKNKKKIIFHDHSPIVDGGDFSIPKGFKTFSKPQFYIGVSSALTEWAKRDLKVRNENIFLLENTVPNKKNIEQTKKKELVHVSNIKPGKNQALVLDILTKSSYAATFYGQIYDQEYFNRLKKEITQGKLTNRISFIHDCASVQEELPQYALGLHTSTFESGPLVLIEYLAQYLPFLAYDTGNVAKKLKKEFPEYFINTLEPSEWNNRINYLLDLPIDKEKMETVYYKLFSTNTYLKECLKIYKNVLSS